jgi:hypothetical protein
MRLCVYVGVMTLGLASVGLGTGQSSSRPRLLVLTDIGGDPDDQQSMVRLMTYANEFDLEGLIATSRMGHGHDVQPQLIQQIVNAYGQVRANLLLHDPDYPTSSALLGVIKRGNPVPGTTSLGAGKDTEGSNWIIQVVDKADSRPVNVSVWGGATDLAQALWRVRNDRTSSQLAAFLAKLRIHAIGDQDTTSPWIRQQFPTLWYIHDLYEADKFQSPYRGMYLGGDTSIRSGTWVSTHVRTNHGPLGALYPATAPGSDGVKEGDTPSWFYFLPNGLNSPERPTWGGWGGRFSGAGPLFLANALDTVGAETSRRATVWRWRPAFQNDFQARMDWCVKPFSGANHAPLAQVVGGTTRTVSPGATVVLDATGSSDPDGHGLSYTWWCYKEAGASVTIANSTSRIASFIAPSAGTVHAILEVKDNGSPPLTAYRRVGVSVGAGQAPVITQPAGDGQTFSTSLAFAGSGTGPFTWHIDRLGDGLAAAQLGTTASSGSQTLSGSIGGVQLDVDGSDYDLILRSPYGEAKRRYRYASTSFSVTVNSVSSGKAYDVAPAAAGALYYIDRSYTLSSTPSGTLIRTSNDDKNVSAAAHLTFTLSGPATVLVGYDKRATKAPTWLSGWTLTSDVVAVSDAPASPLRVYAKSFPAGSVTLGGNQAGGPTGALSHYVVLIRGGSAAAASLAWLSIDDADGDGLRDGAERDFGTDPAKADSDDDGNPDETELDARGLTLWEAQAESTTGEDSEGGRCGLTGAELLLLLLALKLKRP